MKNFSSRLARVGVGLVSGLAQVGLASLVIQPGKPTREFYWNLSKISSGLPGQFNGPACVGWSGLLGTWALLILGQFPKNRSQSLHRPFRISKGWREFLGSLRYLLGTSKGSFLHQIISVKYRDI